MAKITLTDLTSLANDTSATNSINNNFQAVEDYINDNVLSRDTGAEVNTMQNDLDMNSFDILNIAQLNGVDFSTLSDAPASAVAAAASAAAAATSEANAAVSEANAAASAASVDVLLNQQNVWTAAQVGSTQVNSSASGSTTLDFATYNNFILTLTGNITLANPTTETVGQTGFIVFKQDGTGSRTLTLGSEFLTAGGTAITLTTTASAIDVVPYIVSASGEILLGAASLDFM